MTGTSQSLHLFAFCCLFLTVESQRDPVSPLQNVTLQWITDFTIGLTWEPPASCNYTVDLKTGDSEFTSDGVPLSPLWKFENLVMAGGVLNVLVETVCSGSWSFNSTYPELVRNLQCYVHSSKHTNCSWLPTGDAQDLRFFYRLANEDSNRSVTEDFSLPPLQECSVYSDTGGVRTGCSLQANVSHEIHILFNATLDDAPVRNTFRKSLHKNVRPPALKWTVTKTGDQFNISWIPPDVQKLSWWNFIINYTACQELTIKTVHGQTWTTLDAKPHCQYRMAIRAESIWRDGAGRTPLSDEKRFDPAPSSLVYVAVVIPLVFAALAALALVCCKKNQEKMFPKIPKPRDLLSDIPDNNNKSTVCSLYAPAEEEHGCKVTLVTELGNDP